MPQEFTFAFDPRWATALRLLTGATPENSRVVVDDTTFDAAFGRYRVVTPLANIKDVQVTRNYQPAKAIGARASFADRGATFGSNTDGGVCVCFTEPVGALLTKHVPLHPGLTVTVADLDGLAALLRDRTA